MRQPPALFAALQMPLRDALRGVASVADAAHGRLEPAAALLPEPVRQGFREGLDAARSAGRRLMAAPIDEEDVERAAAMLAGRARAPDAFANVVAYAWQHLRGEAPGPLVSETLIAGRFSVRRLRGATPEARAAQFATEFRVSSVIVRRPGLTAAEQAADQAALDHGFTAIAVWLLAARGATMAEEETLLTLSSALVHAARTDMPADYEDEAAFARHLRILADHL